jgi:hypothetical protein
MKKLLLTILFLQIPAALIDKGPYQAAFFRGDARRECGRRRFVAQGRARSKLSVAETDAAGNILENSFGPVSHFAAHRFPVLSRRAPGCSRLDRGCHCSFSVCPSTSRCCARSESA